VKEKTMRAQPAPPRTLSPNVVGLAQSQRAWRGVKLAVTRYDCMGECVSLLPNGDHPRLSVVLEEWGGVCEPRLQASTPCPVAHAPRHMYFAPAGLDLWGHSKNARRIVDAALVFDFDVLSESMQMSMDAGRVSAPRLRFTNERIWNLTKLLAEAVNHPDPSMQLYGDGIITAITSQLFSVAPASDYRPGGLVPWQLRRVVEYMDAHFPDRIELGTLAGIANLSQAHFSRAFKTSTGLAPYQWQLDMRIRRAQTLLANSNLSLADVAQATGFADTVHFGRTFRKLVGVAPGAWRSDSRR
jgi:AraC-like DNA-binding protein